MDFMDFLIPTQESATDDNIDKLELTPADESAIFLTALRSESASDEEFLRVVSENSTELALYGLIEDTEALEATKTIVRMNRFDKFNAVQKRTCIRLAAQANDPLIKRYIKGRTMMKEAREAIFDKYNNKAKTEARKSLSNSKKKAAAMKSAAGRDITSKIDKSIKKFDADARSGDAIKKGDNLN